MDAPPINLKYADNEVVRGILIGKTSDVLFLMENEKVVVIPISSRVKKYDVK